VNNRRRPTMKDVAKHARVSVSTVSYVLNDSGPVAPERRERVLDAVRVLEYSPNESARSLKRQSASTIGLVVPDLTNQFFALIAEGVQRAATERGVLVVLCAPEATGLPEAHHAKLLRSQRLDGVIYLTGTGTLPTAVLELARFGPPMTAMRSWPWSITCRATSRAPRRESQTTAGRSKPGICSSTSTTGPNRASSNTAVGRVPVPVR
jgi:DNA-binding LacI/PurR family transcriptional regulator